MCWGKRSFHFFIFRCFWYHFPFCSQGRGWYCRLEQSKCEIFKWIHVPKHTRYHSVINIKFIAMAWDVVDSFSIFSPSSWRSIIPDLFNFFQIYMLVDYQYPYFDTLPAPYTLMILLYDAIRRQSAQSASSPAKCNINKFTCQIFIGRRLFIILNQIFMF